MLFFRVFGFVAIAYAVEANICSEISTCHECVSEKGCKYYVLRKGGEKCTSNSLKSSTFSSKITSLDRCRKASNPIKPLEPMAEVIIQMDNAIHSTTPMFSSTTKQAIVTSSITPIFLSKSPTMETFAPTMASSISTPFPASSISTPSVTALVSLISTPPTTTLTLKEASAIIATTPSSVSSTTEHSTLSNSSLTELSTIRLEIFSTVLVKTPSPTMNFSLITMLTSKRGDSPPLKLLNETFLQESVPTISSPSHLLFSDTTQRIQELYESSGVESSTKKEIGEERAGMLARSLLRKEKPKLRRILCREYISISKIMGDGGDKVDWGLLYQDCVNHMRLEL